MKMLSKRAMRRLALAGLFTPLGLLTSDAFGFDVKYTYDLSGRVTTALYDNGMCIVYTYDAAGNRTAQTSTSWGTPPAWGSGVWGCFVWTP
jgi:hypothetical protein